MGAAVVYITGHKSLIRMMCSQLFVDLGRKGYKKMSSTARSICSPHFSRAVVPLLYLKKGFYPRDHRLLFPQRKSHNLSPFRIAPDASWCNDCIVLVGGEMKGSIARWGGEALLPSKLPGRKGALFYIWLGPLPSAYNFSFVSELSWW